MAAGAASDMAGSGGASVNPSWVRVSVPEAGSEVVTPVAMMSKAITI